MTIKHSKSKHILKVELNAYNAKPLDSLKANRVNRLK